LRGKGKDQPQWKELVLVLGVPFWEMAGFRGYPPSPRISGIMDLGEKRKIIYGAQRLAGKIFIRKELAAVDEFSRIPLSPWLVSAWWIVSCNGWNHRGL